MTFADVAAGIAVVASLVSTGISVYSQQQQAHTQEALANYNYAIQKQQAELNARVAEQQAQWTAQADRAQAQAQQNNAIAIEQQAQTAQAQGREEARRMRDANDRQLASQRARYGASGVTSEGSPLAVMAESAGQLELKVQDKALDTALQTRELGQKAGDERFNAGLTMMNASIEQYKSAATEAGMNLEIAAAKGGLASGLASAAATQADSYVSLASGISSAAGKAASFNWGGGGGTKPGAGTGGGNAGTVKTPSTR